jgi:hypothetical protein
VPRYHSEDAVCGGVWNEAAILRIPTLGNRSREFCGRALDIFADAFDDHDMRGALKVDAHARIAREIFRPAGVWMPVEIEASVNPYSPHGASARRPIGVRGCEPIEARVSQTPFGIVPVE